MDWRKNLTTRLFRTTCLLCFECCPPTMLIQDHSDIWATKVYYVKNKSELLNQWYVVGFLVLWWLRKINNSLRFQLCMPGDPPANYEVYLINHLLLTSFSFNITGLSFFSRFEICLGFVFKLQKCSNSKVSLFLDCSCEIFSWLNFMVKSI